MSDQPRSAAAMECGSLLPLSLLRCNKTKLLAADGRCIAQAETEEIATFLIQCVERATHPICLVPPPTEAQLKAAIDKWKSDPTILVMPERFDNSICDGRR